MKKTTAAVLVILSVLVLGLSGCKKVPLFAVEGSVLIISSNKVTLSIGGDRARITVTGFTADGDAMHNHTTVVFSATIGRVEPSEVELTNGTASVEFISGNTGGIAEVRARSGTITAEPDPLQITIGSAAVATLSISASPSSFGPGGGRSRVRAHAFDDTGNLLPNIPLVLSTTSGTFETAASVYYTNGDGMVEDHLNLTQTAVVKVESGDKSAETEITVEEQAENQLPTADFSHSPSSPKRGEKVNFNGSLSSDPDGSIVSWEWDFGDGKTGSGERVTHKFNWSGETSQSFTVVLRVTDNQGAAAVATKTVSVEPETANQSPTAEFSYSPSAPKKEETIYFNGGLSSDEDGTIEEWHWDFGDGTTLTGETAEHAYTWSGTGSR
ncbi:MAG: PKD domain-containing protein, partial [bacterium]|nr:PKD domain-containing protein [bacterium]